MDLVLKFEIMRFNIKSSKSSKLLMSYAIIVWSWTIWFDPFDTTLNMKSSII
jgi:hypothetical protein